MRKLTANGTILKGVLKIRNRQMFDADLKTFQDGEVEITVNSVNRKRTSQQNRYYWGVVIFLCRRGLNDLGHDLNEEDTHEFLKAKFNPKNIVFESTGESFEFGASTTEMDTIDFNIYIEKIQQFAAEYLNTVIPDPI